MAPCCGRGAGASGLARTASEDRANDLTAGVTVFPILLCTLGIQRYKFTPTVYPAHFEFALRGTRGLGSLGLDRLA